MGLERVGRDPRIVAPDLTQQRVAADDLVAGPVEIFEDRRFLLGEPHLALLAIDQNFLGRLEGVRADDEDRVFALLVLAQLGARSELEDLAITTNGSQLPSLAPALRDAGVKRLNISLDSLKRDRFAELTRRDRLDQVLAGIEAARAVGFKRIKLNSVVQKGRNDDEILDLVEFAIERGLDISFIEEMPLGSVSSHQRQITFCSRSEERRVGKECRSRWSPYH